MGHRLLRRWARARDITLFKEIRFPHSLGLLYSAFTYYLGFKVNSAEYKVMGLAPYGKPVHFDRIMKEMVHLNAGRLLQAQHEVLLLRLRPAP